MTSSDCFHFVPADALQQLRELFDRGGRQTGPTIARCQAALVEQLVHGPLVSFRVVMFPQPGVVGPAHIQVAKFPSPAGLPADPASETPPAGCWWPHLDP